MCGECHPKEWRGLTSFKTRSLVLVLPVQGTELGGTGRTSQPWPLPARSSWSSEKTFIHALTQPPLTKCLFHARDLSRHQEPKENRTVSSCPQAGGVVCVSRVASRCIRSGVTSLTLSAHRCQPLGVTWWTVWQSGYRLGLLGQTAWVCILALLFTDCEALGK